MHTEIEAVVFDFGGVLTWSPPDQHAERLQRLCGLDRETFDRRYMRKRGEYDRGAIDTREYWSRVVDSKAPPPGSEVVRSLLEADIVAWTRLNQAVLNWAQALQGEGLSTGILSNMPWDMLEAIYEKCTWIERFPARIFSCEVGMIKPEPGIYRACSDALGLVESKILFLDDRPENIEGALRAGMRAVRFRDLGDALGRIAAGGWLAPRLTDIQEYR